MVAARAGDVAEEYFKSIQMMTAAKWKEGRKK